MQTATKPKPAAKPAARAKAAPAKSAAAKKVVTKKTPPKKATPVKKAADKSPKAKAAKTKTAVRQGVTAVVSHLACNEARVPCAFVGGLESANLCCPYYANYLGLHTRFGPKLGYVELELDICFCAVQ